MSTMQNAINEALRASTIVEDEQFVNQYDCITLLSSMTIEYWIYAYFTMTVVGFVAIFRMRKWGILKALEAYERTPYAKYAFMATAAIVVFCPLAKLYIKALQCWVLKVQYREWKKNLTF